MSSLNFVCNLGSLKWSHFRCRSFHAKHIHPPEDMRLLSFGRSGELLSLGGEIERPCRQSVLEAQLSDSCQRKRKFETRSAIFQHKEFSSPCWLDCWTTAHVLLGVQKYIWFDVQSALVPPESKCARLWNVVRIWTGLVWFPVSCTSSTIPYASDSESAAANVLDGFAELVPQRVSIDGKSLEQIQAVLIGPHHPVSFGNAHFLFPVKYNINDYNLLLVWIYTNV